jgi:hypothetical protein
LFNSAINSRLPSSISPNWIKTDNQAISERLEQEPIALLVYLITKAAWGNANGFMKFVAREHNLDAQDAVKAIETAQQYRKEAYEVLLTFPSKHISELLVAVNELINFMKYENTIKDAILPVARLLMGFDDGENDIVVDDMLNAICDSYVVKLDAVMTQAACDAISELEGQDFIEAMNGLSKHARAKIEAPNAALGAAAISLFETLAFKRKLKKDAFDKHSNEIKALFDDENAIIADQNPPEIVRPRNIFDSIVEGKF